MERMILLIDKDPAQWRLMAYVLENERYRTIPHYGSAGAIESIHQHLPDLVILDVWLEEPDSGRRLLDQLWQDLSTVLIPVLVCTSTEDQLGERHQIIRMREYETLAKPFAMDGLLSLVERMIGPLAVSRQAARAHWTSRRGLD